MNNKDKKPTIINDCLHTFKSLYDATWDSRNKKTGMMERHKAGFRMGFSVGAATVMKALDLAGKRSIVLEEAQYTLFRIESEEFFRILSNKNEKNEARVRKNHCHCGKPQNAV